MDESCALGDLYLNELDPVLRQVDHLDGTVRPRDLHELRRDENARIDRNVDAEQVVLHPLPRTRPVVALRSSDHPLGAGLTRSERGDQVHLVVVGHGDHQIRPCNGGLIQDLRARPVPKERHDVVVLLDVANRVRVLVHRDDVVPVLLERANKVSADFTETDDDDVHPRLTYKTQPPQGREKWAARADSFTLITLAPDRSDVVDAGPVASPYYTEDHEAFRRTLRRFVDEEIAPHADAWDEAAEFPVELYQEGSRHRLARRRLSRRRSAASRPTLSQD